MTNWHQEVFNNEAQYLAGDAMEELDETLFELSEDVKPYFSDEPLPASLQPASRKTYNELVYCEDCRALVGKSDECLCLVVGGPSWQSVVARIQEVRGVRASEPSGGCGRTDRKCCGGGCGS